MTYLNSRIGFDTWEDHQVFSAMICVRRRSLGVSLCLHTHTTNHELVSFAKVIFIPKTQP